MLLTHVGLRIHQRKKKELRERQRPRTYYFLQNGSNKLREAQQLDANHSSKCISTTVMEGVNPSTEITRMEQISLVEPTQLPRPAVERRLPGHRPHVKWPGAADTKLWQTVNNGLTLTLKQLQGTLEKKLERRGDIVYQYGAECFGIQEVKSVEKF